MHWVHMSTTLLLFVDVFSPFFSYSPGAVFTCIPNTVYSKYLVRLRVKFRFSEFSPIKYSDSLNLFLQGMEQNRVRGIWMSICSTYCHPLGVFFFFQIMPPCRAENFHDEASKISRISWSMITHSNNAFATVKTGDIFSGSLRLHQLAKPSHFWRLQARQFIR